MDRKIKTRLEFSRQLEAGGIDDALVLSRDIAERVLTEKRVELLQAIADRSVDSKRELARTVDRDISIVSRDLDVLFEASVIDYEESNDSKQPVLSHDNVIVEPIVYDGDVVGADESGADEVVAG